MISYTFFKKHIGIFFPVEPSGWEIESSAHKSRSVLGGTAPRGQWMPRMLTAESIVHGIYQPWWQTRYRVAYPGPCWLSQPVKDNLCTLYGSTYRPSKGQLGSQLAAKRGCFMRPRWQRNYTRKVWSLQSLWLFLCEGFGRVSVWPAFSPRAK